MIENHAAPMVGSVVIVHAGSGAEDWSTQGASHFLEHLLFNGTVRRSQEQIYDETDRLGAYSNATTRSSHVAYLLLAPKDDFWKAFDIQQDMLFHSTLPPEKLEKERGIILEELGRSQEDRSYELERILDLDVFGPQGYGLPTLGSPTSIKTLTRDQIYKFYKGFYGPSRLTWLVIGDVDPAAVVDSLEARVGAEPAGERLPSPVPAVDRSAPLLRIHHAATQDAVLQWTWMGEDPRSQDFNAFAARFDVLCEGDDSPLGSALLARWTGSVDAYSASLTEYPGFSLCSVRLDLSAPEKAAEVLDVVPGLLASVRARAPDPERVEAWKVRAETEEEYMREKPHYYGILRGEMVAARGLPGLVGYLPAIEAVTPEGVASLPPPLPWPPLRISVVLPASPVRADSALAGGRRFQRWDLPNGAAVAALSSPDSPVLAVHLFIRDRSRREPAGKAGIAELLQNMLGRATQDRSASTLSLALGRIGADLKTADSPEIPYDDFYTVPEFSFVRFQTLDRYAPAGFDLLADILGRPAFPEPDFDQCKGAALRRAAMATTSSRSAVSRRLEGFLHPEGDAADVYGTTGTLTPITREDLQAFASSYLDPRSYLFVIASSLSLDSLKALARATLGALPVPAGPSPVASLPAEGIIDRASAVGGADSFAVRARALAAEPGQVRLRRLFLPPANVGKADPGILADSLGSRQAYVQFVRAFDAPDSLRPVLALANAILSDRLARQLRETEGLAYSIGSSLVRESPGTWLWTAAAGTGAANLPRMIQGFREAPAKLLQSPPDEAEAARTAARIYGRGLMRRATRINWAYYAGLAILDGEDPLRIEQNQRALEAVTPAQVTEAVRRYWQEEPGLVVLAR